jgi:hypothetical protein
MHSTEKQSVLEHAISDFKRSVEITRDVRFQANLRLARRHRASAYIVSLLSLYVIALSLIPNILVLQPYQNQILLACSVVLSVFVIFTSLIDGSQNFFHQGELLHQCARKIASIHHELKMLDPANDEAEARNALSELQAKYRDALDECPINHDNVDFYREMATKPHLFPDQFRGHWRWTYVKWNQLRGLVLGHAWLAIHIIAIAVISCIVFSTVLRGSVPLSS